MPLSEVSDRSEDDEPRRYTLAPVARDVAWAIVCLAAFRLAIQVVVPLVYIATGNTQLSETHRVGIYFVVNVTDLGALIAIAYYFACTKYGVTFREGFSFHSVPAGSLVGSVIAAACLVAFDLIVSSRFSEPPTAPVWLLSPPLGAVAFAVELLLQPFAIVLFYLGFVYGAFRWLGEIRALIVVVILYAVQSWLGRGPVTLMISPALLAAILAVQTRRYDSVIPALVTVFIHRLAMVIVLTESLVTGELVGR